MAAVRRARKEAKNCQRVADRSFWIETSDNDLEHSAFIQIKSPFSPYKGCTLELSVYYPSDYPFKAPKIVFVTDVNSPNVSLDGIFHLKILRHGYNPAAKMVQVLNLIVHLLEDFDSSVCVLRPELAQALKCDPLRYILETSRVARLNCATFRGSMDEKTLMRMHEKTAQMSKAQRAWMEQRTLPLSVQPMAEHAAATLPGAAAEQRACTDEKPIATVCANHLEAMLKDWTTSSHSLEQLTAIPDLAVLCGDPYATLPVRPSVLAAFWCNCPEVVTYLLEMEEQTLPLSSDPRGAAILVHACLAGCKQPNSSALSLLMQMLHDFSVDLNPAGLQWINPQWTAVDYGDLWATDESFTFFQAVCKFEPPQPDAVALLCQYGYQGELAWVLETPQSKMRDEVCDVMIKSGLKLGELSEMSSLVHSLVLELSSVVGPDYKCWLDYPGGFTSYIGSVFTLNPVQVLMWRHFWIINC